MCAQAISIARLRRLYFGAFDPKGAALITVPKIFAHELLQTCPRSLWRY